MLKKLAAFSAFVGKTFAIWIIILAVFAYKVPSAFTVFTPYIPFMLGVAMFGMGLTLRPSDFAEILKRPLQVIIGIVCQFVFMPGIAWLLCMIFQLPAEIAVGVILVGCCPGGTASNVIAYLAKGDVALSVTITACTTLLAPIVTPALMYVLASHWIEISMLSMLISIVKIVILPIFLGVTLNVLFGKALESVMPCLPLISVVTIVIIISTVIAVSHAQLAETGLKILSIVMLHNCLGCLLGYLAGRFFGFDLRKRKTLAIEVGMQNSGLGVALSMTHFSPITAVPSAIFSVWHNMSGTIMVTIFNHMKEEPSPKNEQQASLS